MRSERDLQINPVVVESVVHNTKVLSNTHNLTASIFGIGAGILGLESYSGFIFYLVFSIFTTALIYGLRVLPGASAKTGGQSTPAGPTAWAFDSALGFWTSGLVDGMSGFVLTWTLVYGLIRA